MAKKNQEGATVSKNRGGRKPTTKYSISPKTVREHLEETDARRVWFSTSDAVVEDLASATVEGGHLLLDQPAIRNGADLIDPRDGGRWLTIIEEYDRDEFEQDQVHQDREAESVADAYLLERSRRFSEAMEMERLEAEAAEIDPIGAKLAEQEIRVENLTSDPVQYRVLVPTDERELAAEASGPRFGDRLRQSDLADDINGSVRLDKLLALADAIDQDAVELLDVHERHIKSHMRRQVEEVVERLRYSVDTPPQSSSGWMAGAEDVVGAEEFLVELDRIFGERPEPTAEVKQPSFRDLLPPRCSSVSWKLEQCALPQGHKGPHHNESCSAIWAACGGTEGRQP